ncbi:MAG: metal ABC transporter permease [Thermoproteota archaeon]
MKQRIALAFPVLMVAAAYLLLGAVNPVWALAMLSAGLAFGSAAAIVAARRMYFLSAAAPHAALLAAAAGALASASVGGDPYIWTAALGLMLVYGVGYAIHRGVDPDAATSVFVSLTASLSVMALYIAYTRTPAEVNIAGLVAGDPLLASRSEAVAAAVAGAASLGAVLLSYTEHVCIGLDPATARVAGIRTWVYDLIAFTVIGLSASIMIRVVGFVLEHVLVLLPASAAVTLSASAIGVLYLSLVLSLAGAASGLYLSLALNVPPAGGAGLVLLAAYLAALAYRRAVHGGQKG